MIQIKPTQTTNLRPDPHTLNSAIKSYVKDSIVTGDTWFIATQDLYNGTKQYQKKGDKWLHVTAIQEPGKPEVQVSGWMSVIHMGSSVGLPVIIRDDQTPAPTPTPTKKIISAVLYYDDGTTEELLP